MTAIPETIYHYCSADSLLGILQSRALWLTHILYFEDQDEHLWFKRIACERIRAQPDFQDSLALTQLLAYLESHEFEAIYCTCFSMQADMLTQWKAYADNANGFAIGFNTKKLQQIVDVSRLNSRRLQLIRVEYDREEQQKSADAMIRFVKSAAAAGESDALGAIARELAATGAPMTACHCKNPLFRAEEEVRLISYDQSGQHLFRTRGRNVIPYITIPFPDDDDEPIVREIVFGPRYASPIVHRRHQDQSNAIGLLMRENGFNVKNLKFRSSEITLL
jgi:hypothetical protein